MLGNIQEWTAGPFLPVSASRSTLLVRTRSLPPGAKFCAPAWATRSRLADAAYRNFFGPERRGVFAGFPTVAL